VVARPRLFERLASSARVAVLSAPPGSGKTVLLQSWTGAAGVAERVAWVPVGRDERDPQRFWLAVVGGLRRTVPGARLVGDLTAAPDLDGWALVERLLKDLASLEDRIWLVVDDVHELGPAETLRQLELLVMRAPPQLRFVLTTRQDVRLGLHRLRVAGELTEIRGSDLQFTADEARELFRAAGVELPESALTLLFERSEGWAAGLRLAALALAGDRDPGRFAEEFSGSERTVAEYLLAEVLDRQPESVRRLLLRTSVLELVNAELADLLTGHPGSEAILQDLEEKNAFVMAVDGRRTWFRYHHLFADLLQRELRRSEAGEVTALHAAATEWFAGHGYPAEAVRHAQAAQDWALAARLLADHWPALQLDGHAATAHELLARFPVHAGTADPELAALAAADELAGGSPEAAGRQLRLAERESTSVPDSRRGQFEILLGIARLLHARHRGNPQAVLEEGQRLQAAANAPEAGRPGLGEELQALALISLGSAQAWTTGFEGAARRLEQGIELARRAGRPYLEFTGLAYQAVAELYRSSARASELSDQAIDLAERHGWTDEAPAGIGYLIRGTALAWQGRPEEAEPWVQRAERAITAEAEPAARLHVHFIRGRLELGRGEVAAALGAFEAAERLAECVDDSNLLAVRVRVMLVFSLVRLGEIERAERTLASLGEGDRGRAETRTAIALLRLAQHDPGAAAVALAPVLDASGPAVPWFWLAHAFLLEAVARDRLGDAGAAGHALERALDLAEPGGMVTLFTLCPAPELLQRHARQRTAHASLIADILSLLAGRTPPPRAGPQPPLEALSYTEIRVLRYLPTHLTAPEIARELSVSHNTIRTHMTHLYTKLGTHRRADTVARARSLGLLAPSPPDSYAMPPRAADPAAPIASGNGSFSSITGRIGREKSTFSW
jgi:LuxR family maltose regulon positive regulatory protein